MYITYMYYKKDQKNNKKIDTHDIHQYTYIYYYIVVSYIIYVIMYYSCTVHVYGHIPYPIVDV